MSRPLTIEPPTTAGTIPVGERCLIYEDPQGARVVMVGGQAVFRYQRGDTQAEALFVALALELRWARAGELARALGWTLRRIHRARQRYVREGAAGLAPKRRGPKGPRLGATREMAIRRWHGKGISQTEMARRLGIGRATVHRALVRLGLLTSPRPATIPLPLATPPDGPCPTLSVPSVATDNSDVPPAFPVEPAATDCHLAGSAPLADPAQPLPISLDADPGHRVIDRALAAQGLLDDAAPLFASALAVPRAGILLAIPLLVATGVFDAARQTLGSLGPAFYGLRTMLVTLVFLALLRIKHPENIKEYNPSELGRIIGLDRAPEVKTIRRKLAELSADGQQVDDFLQELLRRRVQAHEEALGFLYVDGHVRVYAGKVDLPKTHIARMRISLPATQEMWVNDARGDPLFVITQKAHPQLVSALPPLLEKVRVEVGDERRVTVVFDRGGWSPVLFLKMDALGFDVLTYRKGTFDDLPLEAFTRHEVPGTEGRKWYDLADGEVTLSNGFVMRQVVRRTENGHQTAIMTTRRDLSTVEVAVRMFDRWRQENFFKYMRQEYAIDALVEYGAEPDDPARMVPNPARTVANKALREARSEEVRLEARYGAAVLEAEALEGPPAGKKAEALEETRRALEGARQRVAELEQQRAQLPERVAVGETRERVERLPPLRKRLSDGLKMLAYQVETDLVRLVAPFYRRSADEGRTLLCAALQSTADLEVTGEELRVTLAAQSSPHRTAAIAELCALLNDTATCFPGTELRLHFAIREAKCDK